jgi:CelD/BcsL family acetyltransferase involved in cellulose biosynthesis
MLSPIRVVEGHDPARLAALEGEWRELHDAASANPFQSFEWLHSWWRAFGGRRPIWTFEARDRANRLAGLLVLAGKPGISGARRFGLLGNGVTGADGLDVLARPAFAAPVRAAFAQAIAEGASRWDALDLEDLPCGSPTVAALRAALHDRGAAASVEFRFVCPGFALRGTFAEHLARTRRRETYGRRVRWLERQPGYALECVADPAAARAAIDDFLRLHHLRWDGAGGSYGIPRGAAEEFHREVAPLLARRGWLKLWRMRVGGRSIAAVYGIELKGRFHYYQSGMDPAWAPRSPGLALLGKTIEDAYARGLTDYDFLRGTEPHKLDWACDRRELVALRAWAPGLRAEAAHAAEGMLRAARDAARAVAPESLWSALRRARRSWEVNGEAGAAGDDPAHRHERGTGR